MTVGHQSDSEELSKCRVVGLARLALDVFLNKVLALYVLAIETIYTKSFVNQNLRTASIRPNPSSESPILNPSFNKLGLKLAQIY